MEIKDIKAIYKFLRETDIVELEIEGAAGKLRLKRGVAAGVAQPVFQAPAAAPAQAPAPKSANEIKKEEAERVKAENIKIVTSPMVGTYYRSASPESQPFVELGSIVKSGQTLCIIEAMKLMNEVECEYNGKIVQILVDNGQPVEYGEPLFHVEVSK